MDEKFYVMNGLTTSRVKYIVSRTMKTNIYIGTNLYLTPRRNAYDYFQEWNPIVYYKIILLALNYRKLNYSITYGKTIKAN